MKRFPYLKALCANVLVVGGLAVGSMEVTQAQTTLSTAAALTGTIQPAGPRQGANGDNFLNMEGSSSGAFASYGIVRFDVSGIKSSFDAQFGAGNYTISGVTLQMTQDPAAFTHDGGLNIAYGSGATIDTDDIKTPASPYKYPTPAPAQETITTGLFTRGTETYLTASGMTTPGRGHIDTYNLFVGNQASVDLANHILQGGSATLIVNPTDPDTAATYRGQVPDMITDISTTPPTIIPVESPTLFVTATSVPGPSALGMFGMGLIPLLGAARRRRKRP